MTRETDFQTGEDDTILDQSLYTATDATLNSMMDKSTVISTATTVKQSSRNRRRGTDGKRGQPHGRPVLQTADIAPTLQSYQQNRVSYRSPPTVVTPDSTSSSNAKTPQWGNTTASKKKQQAERYSDFYSPDTLKGLDLIPSPDTTESTTERIRKIEPSCNTYRFEFDASMEDDIPKRTRGDHESGSVHSFSFSQNEDEIGFELDEFAMEEAFPLPNSYAEDRNDESSSCSELSVDVSARVNMSDTDLLDGRSSPGALRLTAEGLKHHENRSFQQARKRPERHSDEFEAWRKEHETRKWYRQRLKEREQKLLNQSLQLQENSSQKNKDNPKKGRCVSFRSDSDVAGVSLAPLAAMQHLSLHENGKQKKKTFPLFRKRSKPTAEELLERERQREREAKRLEEHQKRREKERIQRKRREHVERQRAKEIVSGGALNRNGNIDRREMTCSTLSSLSTATPVMPHCVLCLEEVRTHIATPCMHFSFCAKCVEKLEASNKKDCPVCRQPNVSYASVAV